jgi:diguanylate cyclase (GGDEF)-like protein
MTFDGRSLLAVAAALGILLGMLVLALERRLAQPVPGLRAWALANFALGAAASLQLLQGIAPPWVPTLAGMSLILVARAMNVAALRQFDHRHDHALLLSMFCTGLVLALAAMSFAWPNPAGRDVAMTGGVAALAMAAVLSLATGAPASISRCLAMLGFAGLSLAHLAHPWLHAGTGLGTAEASAVPATIALLLILDVLCNVGFLLMVTDRVNEWVLRLARTDPLTGVLARGALVVQAQRDLLRARRQGSWTAAFIVGVDGFQGIDGPRDPVLRHVALHGHSVLRCTDLFGRLGSHLFVAVLPDTDLLTAGEIAERLRTTVAEPTPGVPSDLPPITVSIGVAAAAAGTLSLDDLVARAEAALHDAGKTGRNRTRLAPAAPPPAKTPLRLIRGGRQGHAP